MTTIRPAPPPGHPTLAEALDRLALRQARRGREAEALVRSLSDADLAEIAGCRHRAEALDCCGPRTVCAFGRIRSDATATEDCARCVTAGLDR